MSLSYFTDTAVELAEQRNEWASVANYADVVRELDQIERAAVQPGMRRQRLRKAMATARVAFC